MNSANLSLVFIPLVIAVADWIAIARNRLGLRFLTKPGVMLALLGLLWHFTGYQGRMIWFAFALVFSLAGDIFMILPHDRFKLALLSFLFAHISYIIAYGSAPSAPLLDGLLLLVVLVCVGVPLHKKIVEGLAIDGKEHLKIPVLIYQLAISIMVLSALNTLWLPDWTLTSAIWLSAGALLFFISDSILAWSRFVRQISHGRLMLTIAYHLGQIALIIGGILHFPTF